MQKELKVFEIDWSSCEKSWVAAYTNLDALKYYLNTTGMSLGDLQSEDSITEVPKEKWGEMTITYHDEDIEDKTFEQRMKELTEKEIIAETIY